METVNTFKVGDYVFLFFSKTGTIFSSRILEKTIRETISDGPKTEFILEAYRQEGEHIAPQKIKFSDEKCKMFRSIEELKIELQEHVMNAVNEMIDECQLIYGKVSHASVE